jgi:hypothetical protein
MALIRGAMLAEQQVKIQDTYTPYVGVPSAGTLFLLNGIPQYNSAGGVSPNPYERLGDRVVNDKLLLRYGVASPGGLTGDSFNAIRVIVFWWANNLASASGPIPADVLEYVGIAQAPYSPTKYTSTLGMRGSRPQLTVVHDETYALSSSGPMMQVTSLTFPLNGRAVNYVPGSSPSGGLVSILGDALFLLAITDSASPPDAQIAFTARLSYRDAQ